MPDMMVIMAIAVMVISSLILDFSRLFLYIYNIYYIVISGNIRF